MLDLLVAGLHKNYNFISQNRIMPLETGCAFIDTLQNLGTLNIHVVHANKCPFFFSIPMTKNFLSKLLHYLQDFTNGHFHNKKQQVYALILFAYLMLGIDRHRLGP